MPDDTNTHRSHIAVLFLAATILSSLAGCLAKVAMDKSASDRIRTIALLDVSIKEVRVFDAKVSSPALTSQLTHSLRGKLVAATIQALQEELAARGFAVTYLSGVSAPRSTAESPKFLGVPLYEHPNADLAYDYSQVTTDADAILHVLVLNIGFSYYDNLFSPSRRPLVEIRAKLLDGRTKAVLYARTFEFGGITRIHWEEEHIPAEEVPNDQLVSPEKIDQAGELLVHGIREIATRIAQQLR